MKPMDPRHHTLRFVIVAVTVGLVFTLSWSGIAEAVVLGVMILAILVVTGRVWLPEG